MPEELLGRIGANFSAVLCVILCHHFELHDEVGQMSAGFLCVHRSVVEYLAGQQGDVLVVGRRFAGEAEVLGRAHDAAAEEGRLLTIHCHPADQRVVGGGDEGDMREGLREVADQALSSWVVFLR